MFPDAALAQLVEQQFCKLKVPSSNLGSGSLKKKTTHMSGFLFYSSPLTYV